MTAVGLSLFNYQDDARSNKHKTVHVYAAFVVVIAVVVVLISVLKYPCFFFTEPMVVVDNTEEE